MICLCEQLWSRELHFQGRELGREQLSKTIGRINFESK